MNIYGMIPARYASTRFPGKPLADIQGKPMIQHVVERCNQSRHLNGVIVATDDQRIFNVVSSFGGTAVMTDPNHTNGTERCAEAANNIRKPVDFILNIQGDEPLISSEQIDQFCELLIAEQPEIATIIRPLQEQTKIDSPNVVKCVVNARGQAMYFSRSVIPYPRNNNTKNHFFQHIGLYAFQKDVLQTIVKLPPSTLEKTESLEQLRWLENGYTIHTTITNEPTYAVDTPEDIETILEQMSNE